MSRTDVHAPYWTWATWYEPCHHLWCPYYLNRSWQKTRKDGRTCTLPKQPVRHAVVRTRVYVPLCTWEPVWPSYREAVWLVWRGHTPRWLVRHTWSGPERVRERDQLGKMVKEYNANGELDDGDFPTYRARRASWWWD